MLAPSSPGGGHGGFLVQRPLTDAELQVIRTALHGDVASLPELVQVTAAAVFGALTLDLGQPGAAPADVDRARFAIPAIQWDVIAAAIIDRARDWHMTITAEMLLRQRMPHWYHDPSITAPQLGPPDGRPYRASIELTRSAADTITAAENHIEALCAAYGLSSGHYHRAADTWRAALAHLLAGWRTSHTTVQTCGPLSLQVTDAAGNRSRILFHGDRWRCAVPGCGAWATCQPPTSTEVLWTPATATAVAAHQHEPGYPFEGPQPGVWRIETVTPDR